MALNKIVFDANIWARFCRSDKIFPLTQRIQLYFIIPVLDNYLLSEIHQVILKNEWLEIEQADRLIGLINSLSLNLSKSIHSTCRISPDPKDNFLFDLAIQGNCSLIISDDAKLLQFPLKPVPVRTSNWFLKSFPL